MNLPTSLFGCLTLGWLAGVCLTACVDKAPVTEDDRRQASAQQSVPLRKPPAGQVTSQYTLAIVPWNATERPYISELNGLDALRTALANADFVPVMSAYDVPNTQTARFPQTERALFKRVWGWRSPGQGPAPEATWRLGEELGIDAVLAYGMEPREGPIHYGRICTISPTNVTIR